MLHIVGPTTAHYYYHTNTATNPNHHHPPHQPVPEDTEQHNDFKFVA